MFTKNSPLKMFRSAPTMATNIMKEFMQDAKPQSVTGFLSVKLGSEVS